MFLKIAYHGPKAMEELVAYDPHLVPGILGGSSGTTYDAFKLLEEAKKYGARAALFGRKINNSEHQLTFVSYLRAIADGKIEAAEACKAYHGELEKLKIKPYRPLKDDLELTTTATSYAGGGQHGVARQAAGEAASGRRPKPTVAAQGDVQRTARRRRRPDGVGPTSTAAAGATAPTASAQPTVAGLQEDDARAEGGSPEVQTDATGTSSDSRTGMTDR